MKHYIQQNWQKKKIQQSKEHQLKAFEEINDVIVKSRHGRRIVLTDETKLVEFMSCSYLGLDQDKRVVQAACNHLQQCGVNFAVARTRMRVESFVILEELLNRIFKGHSVSFSSLHITHLGMFPLLASGEMPSFLIHSNGPLFIIDKIAHASIQINRGLLEQFGEVTVVDFNELGNLEEHFKYANSTKRTPIAIADGIGSMGGVAPIDELFQWAEKWDGYIYLDDAHGVSVYGTHGCGYVLSKLKGYHPRLMLAVSLSKAFGANGAAIVVPTLEDEKIIRRFCNPYLFSNPLPLSIVDSAIAAGEIHLSNEIYRLQKRLQNHLSLFDSAMSQSKLLSEIINYNTSSPIRGIIIGDEFKSIQLTLTLRKLGFALTAAMYPTVPKGKSMLRITLGADHHEEDIHDLTKALLELLN